MWASGVAKVSIALALLRLTVRQSHRIILWTAICASVTVGLVFWFFMVLQCHPVSEFWERTGRGQCLDTSVLLAVAYVYSSICAACDLALGLLPILLVRKLQINPRTKIALGATLSMGCVYVPPPCRFTNPRPLESCNEILTSIVHVWPSLFAFPSYQVTRTWTFYVRYAPLSLA